MKSSRRSGPGLARSAMLRRAAVSLAALVALATVPVASLVHELRHLGESHTQVAKSGSGKTRHVCPVCVAFAGAGSAMVSQLPTPPQFGATPERPLAPALPAAALAASFYLERAPPRFPATA